MIFFPCVSSLIPSIQHVLTEIRRGENWYWHFLSWLSVVKSAVLLFLVLLMIMIWATHNRPLLSSALPPRLTAGECSYDGVGEEVCQVKLGPHQAGAHLRRDCQHQPAGLGHWWLTVVEHYNQVQGWRAPASQTQVGCQFSPPSGQILKFIRQDEYISCLL